MLITVGMVFMWILFGLWVLIMGLWVLANAIGLLGYFKPTRFIQKAIWAWLERHFGRINPLDPQAPRHWWQRRAEERREQRLLREEQALPRLDESWMEKYGFPREDPRTDT